MIRFTCQCGKAFKVGDEHAGKKSKCPGCQTVLTIPRPEQVAAAATPAALPLVSPPSPAPAIAPQPVAAVATPRRASAARSPSTAGKSKLPLYIGLGAGAVVLIVIVVIVVSTASVVDDAADIFRAAGLTKSDLTGAQYDRVGEGMTIAQVEEILGKGTEQVSANMSGGGVTFDVRYYMWGEGLSSITVGFMNGKAMNKSQLGIDGTSALDTFSANAVADDEASITLAMYNRLANDMMLAEVEDILGPGVNQSSVSSSGGGTTMEGGSYIWQDGMKFITIIFVNGKAVSMAQVGLE